MDKQLITQYRKESWDRVKPDIDFEKWFPNTDANQREMIEDWLDNKGCILYYDNEDFHTWTIAPMVKGRPKFTCYDKSKLIAFMKAFMEFNNEAK